MGRHDTTALDRARDELMSHVVRCEVLDAEHDDRREWLSDTMDYMAERYPQLTDLHITQLEMIGRQFIKPAIPHGAGHTAISRDRRLEQRLQEEADERMAADAASDEELQAAAA